MRPDRPQAGDDVDIRLKEWRLDVLSKSEKLYGKVTARAMWHSIGMPPVPAFAGENAQALDGEACFAVIAAQHGDAMKRFLDGDDKALRRTGLMIRGRQNARCIHVAFSDPHLDEIYAPTVWRNNGWSKALRRILGAEASMTVFDDVKRKSTKVPLGHLSIDGF